MSETIKTESLGEEKISKISNEARNGKLLVYPTETAYGLGTNALNKGAVRKIYNLKNRVYEKKLTVLVSSLEMAEKYCYLNENEREILEKFMPGPLTLLAEKRRRVPDILNDKFAFRISPNKIATKIVSEMKFPLVATSANISGEGNLYSIKNLDDKIKERVNYIIDQGSLEETPVSTIVDLSEGKLKILREGPVKREEIEEFLR